MRDYGKVSPQFWIGETGRALRGNVEAQLVAVYLMTSPHANMIGVFHCPIAYIAHETGLTSEGASKGLRRLIEADFCTYDEASEYVFVHEFAAHQVGESLEPSDKRCKGVDNELSKVPKGQCWQAFRARYAVPYNLPIPAQTQSPSEAPSKPLRSQKQEQEQKQEQKEIDPSGLVASADAEAPPAQVVKLADRRIPCPAERLLEAFHAECPTLPKVMKLNDRRRTHLTSRWREVDADSKFTSADDGIEVFRGIFRKVNASDFLAGRAKAWHATFDWLTESSTNFLKVCEGHYDNDRRAAK